MRHHFATDQPKCERCERWLVWASRFAEAQVSDDMLRANIDAVLREGKDDAARAERLVRALRERELALARAWEMFQAAGVMLEPSGSTGNPVLDSLANHLDEWSMRCVGNNREPRSLNLAPTNPPGCERMCRQEGSDVAKRLLAQKYEWALGECDSWNTRPLTTTRIDALLKAQRRTVRTVAGANAGDEQAIDESATVSALMKQIATIRDNLGMLTAEFRTLCEQVEAAEQELKC
jgi:hypothetical protein